MYSFVEKAQNSPKDTIVASTKLGAEKLKVGDITGTLEKVKFADLLVIDENPLENIRDIYVENMTDIMKEGDTIKNIL